MARTKQPGGGGAASTSRAVAVQDKPASKARAAGRKAAAAAVSAEKGKGKGKAVEESSAEEEEEGSWQADDAAQQSFGALFCTSTLNPKLTAASFVDRLHDPKEQSGPRRVDRQAQCEAFK